MAAIAHIEDCISDYLILKEIVGPRFKISHFPDLKAFLESKESYDLIISDLRLPDSYGFETVKAVKKTHVDTPIIILTGMGGAFMTGDLIQGLFESGADNVISKELLADNHLLAVLEEVLQLEMA